MKRIMLLSATAVLLFSSCVSNKKYAELEEQQKQTQDELNTATIKLNACLEDKQNLNQQISRLNNTNAALLNNVGDLATLSKKEAENLERSLESIKEKDLAIQSMRDAISKKDSVTLALVTSLKGALGNMADEDIEINVEKGVVYVSISDKLLFDSGRYNVTDRAKEVLGKVATVVKNKPDIEFMVEGHTDDKAIKTSMFEDNWDLSVKRATSVVRILQDEFGVEPARMTAAGRSYYVPVATNETAEGRAKNRRTRIVVLPKLDQFYGMIEEGMKSAE
ncbi:OmpA/MotB family protein [Salegentibacter mishustinae]|jgi:chemotaxis protein MotB|uniref:OmpA/MotB family protein n=1 Tax=Salegentibacter mishustinae TaxID=270918 RepID=UPI001CE05DE4|nr:OmpA family protein [Salegentibacter mishustinae]MDX1426926.1 OmpA family protein [Salegentibacter mishustinae]MDX1719752.1 OmpA family protein [Salegentibacter mishustinae]UBZ07355.1 OmpA family protein [Salegentibacter mishustinae]|tara:strand:- start:500 stop:1333 length:834 start_codon:yes stop_codon:yes gene_type:complete